MYIPSPFLFSILYLRSYLCSFFRLYNMYTYCFFFSISKLLISIDTIFFPLLLFSSSSFFFNREVGILIKKIYSISLSSISGEALEEEEEEDRDEVKTHKWSSH